MKDIARRRGKRFLVQKHSSVSARTKCYYNIDSAHFCVIPDIDRLWSRHSCETGECVDHSSELVTGKICGIKKCEHPLWYCLSVAKWLLTDIVQGMSNFVRNAAVRYDLVKVVTG